jgi:hypothetical protein
MTFKELLIQLNACGPAIDWAGDMTIEQVVADCHRGDWLLWLAQRVGVEKRPLTLAKALCAKTVVHLMKNESSVKAVDVAERYGMGEAADEELSAAAAYAAYAAADYADAAAYAADAAADYADAAADYADAAAYAADAAAYAAAYAADAAAYAAAYAADAYAANQKLTSKIVRDTIGAGIIEKVNQKLKGSQP